MGSDDMNPNERTEEQRGEVYLTNEAFAMANERQELATHAPARHHENRWLNKVHAVHPDCKFSVEAKIDDKYISVNLISYLLTRLRKQ